MAVGDVVVMSFGGSVTGAPKLRGFVTGVPGPDQSDVLWENGEFVAAIPDALLFKCFSPETLDQSVQDVIGRWVQLNDWPLNGAERGPKSPAAAGIVRRAYGIASIGDAQPSTAFLEMEVLDGKAALEVAALPGPPGPITVQGRRKVQEL